MSAISRQIVPIGLIALGQYFVVVSGNIDLSVGSVMGFIGALAAVMIVNMDMPFLLTIVICLVAGGLIGAAQGFFGENAEGIARMIEKRRDTRPFTTTRHLAEAIEALLAAEGETVHRLGRVTAGQGVAYTGTLS